MNSAARFDGFVTVDNGCIIDAAGNPVLLRGMGLGNWLIPEGYMWRLSPGSESAREIEALITELVGQERADQFWIDFRDRFISDADIGQIATEGMDHVRLPINWRVVMDPDGTVRDDGFDRIDDLIRWCRASGIWVLLDLHGAPGGQTGTNIDDSLGQPELFMDERYIELTERLWVELASRYSNETAVLGYDLLNEPLPNEWQHRYPDELVALYRRLTSAIRRVDTNHLIMYEGSHWATNWSIFTEVWDPNSVLQFHKYWSPPDRPSIQEFVDIGERLGLPIYMGEGGENNTSWLSTAFQLYEDHGIGWNFWPWKKIETMTSPCSIKAPHGWADIVAYANGTGNQPSPDDAWATLNRLVDACHLDQCTYQPEIIRALFRRVPLSLPATAFGFKGPGRSHDAANPVPLDGFRADDDITICCGASGEIPGFDHTDGTADEDLVVRLDEGDWIVYDIETVTAGGVDIELQCVAEPSGIPELTLDGRQLATVVSGSSCTATTTAGLSAGRHELRVTGPANGCHILRIDIQDRPSEPQSVRIPFDALVEADPTDAT